MDLTPDWLVTRKNRDRIGTPISTKGKHRHDNANQSSARNAQECQRESDARTKWFRFIPLVILPQGELEDSLGCEIFLDQVLPVRQRQLLLILIDRE